LYTFDTHSTAAGLLMKSIREGVLLSHFAQLEFINALHLRRFRGEITSAAQQAAEESYNQDLRDQVFVLRSLPDAAFAKGIGLACLHTQGVGIRTSDVLHVGAALVLGADTLYSFDVRQRKLAAAEGLRVLPQP
jgi:predicted nucleic acid-binding protein